MKNIHLFTLLVLSTFFACTSNQQYTAKTTQPEVKKYDAFNEDVQNGELGFTVPAQQLSSEEETQLLKSISKSNVYGLDSVMIDNNILSIQEAKVFLDTMNFEKHQISISRNTETGKTILAIIE